MSAPFLPTCIHNSLDFYLSSVQFDLYFAGQNDSKTLQSLSSWYLIFSYIKSKVCLWQQATREITRSLLLSPLVRTINCSLALPSQALLEVTRLDHSIGITLLLLVCATYVWVLFFTHIPFVVNRTMNVTPIERLQHHFRHWHAYEQKVWQILQAWRNQSSFPSQLIALKSKLKFCHTVPSPRDGAFVGLVPLKQSFKPPQLKYKAP